MHPGPLLLLLAAALPAPAERVEGATPVRAGAPAPPGAGARRERADAVLRSGEEARRGLVREAREGPAAARRAALEALGTLPAGSAPAGTLEAALEALGARDPLLRGAAVRALVACGEPARTALAGLLRATPGRRELADALHDLLRHEVERDFLASWTPDDGSYRGMYGALRRHGAFGARVLAAVALDRRMAGREVLGYGPYAWVRGPDRDRERADIRFRALDALEDAGTPEARERLRSLLRPEPARELLDDFDFSPVPAPVDDAVRIAIAALGDAAPLWQLIRASEGSRHGAFDEAVERKRRARAYAALGESEEDPRARRLLLDEGVGLLRGSLRLMEYFEITIDGVEYYNLACAVARRDAPGDRAEALDLLARAVRTYAVTADWILRDGDLAALRGEPAFGRLVEGLRQRERRLREALPQPGK